MYLTDQQIEDIFRIIGECKIRDGGGPELFAELCPAPIQAVRKAAERAGVVGMTHALSGRVFVSPQLVDVSEHERQGNETVRFTEKMTVAITFDLPEEWNPQALIERVVAQRQLSQSV